MLKTRWDEKKILQFIYFAKITFLLTNHESNIITAKKWQITPQKNKLIKLFDSELTGIDFKQDKQDDKKQECFQTN